MVRCGKHSVVVNTAVLVSLHGSCCMYHLHVGWMDRAFFNQSRTAIMPKPAFAITD